MRGAPAQLEAQLRLPTGLGTLGVGLFLVGMLEWNRGLLLLVLVPLAAWGAVHGWRQRRHPRWGNGRGWIWALAPWLLILGLDALVPPMGGLGNDAVAYHLLGPLQWLRMHHIAALHDNLRTSFPALVETLFGAVIAIANVRTAKLVALLFGLLLLQQIWGLIHDLGGDDYAAGLGVALLACMPVVMALAALPFVDLAYAVFAIASARLAWAASEPRHWLLAGALTGFAIGTKYTGLLLLLATLLSLSLLRRSHPAGEIPQRRLALFAAAALVCGGAWYVRNAIVFLAPVYPLPLVAGNHWPGRYMSVAAVRQFQAYMVWAGAGMGRSLMDLLLFPFRYTFEGARFQGGGGLGIVPLAFGPIAAWHLRRNRLACFWMLWSLVLTLLWFYSMQESRYLIPVLTVWAAFAVLAAARLMRGGTLALRGLTVLAVTVSLVYGAAGMAWDNGQRPARIASLFSTARAAALWQRNVPYAAAFAFLNREPDSGRVLLLDRHALAYYLHRPYVVVQGQWGEQPLGPITDAQVLARLRPLGISEVLDVRSSDSGFHIRAPEPASLRLEFSSPDARVYHVDP